MRCNVIKYIGGKWFMVDEIIKALDYSVNCYIELFGGSAKVLLNKPKHNVEIYNDKNDVIYNLFYVIKNNTVELLTKFCNGYIEKYYYNTISALPNVKDPIEKAVLTLFAYNASFSGSRKGFSYSYCRNVVTEYFNKVDAVRNASERLQDVILLNYDFRDVLYTFRNDKNLIIYADPPYWGSEYYYEDVGFNDNDHFDLADLFNKANYKILISYYYFDKLPELYPVGKWRYYKVEQKKHCTKIDGTNRRSATELLISNYDIGGLEFVDLDKVKVEEVKTCNCSR